MMKEMSSPFTAFDMEMELEALSMLGAAFAAGA
jgi:hypothetical protein